MTASEIPPGSGGSAGDAEAATSEGVASQGEKWTRFAGRISKAFGLVLLLVVATYVVASLTRYTGWSAVAILALATGSAVVAVVSSGGKAATVSWAIGLAVGSVVLAAVAALSGTGGFLATASFIEILLLISAVAAVLRDVLTESEVGFRTILGAISVYMIFGLLFTSLYVAIDRLQAGPFFSPEPTLHTGDFIFFSFTTLTTTGYGNLVPADQPGKMFAGLEMLFGQIFLVTLIAGLVTLWRPGHLLRNYSSGPRRP